jgi:hypothetical protein
MASAKNFKKMGFRYKRRIEGRNLPKEQSDAVATRAVFLSKLHKIKQSGRACICHLYKKHGGQPEPYQQILVEDE